MIGIANHVISMGLGVVFNPADWGPLERYLGTGSGSQVNNMRSVGATVVATLSTTVGVSTDEGQTWSNVVSPAVNPREVMIDPTNESKWVLCSNIHPDTHIFVTVNGGSTFSNNHTITNADEDLRGGVAVNTNTYLVSTYNSVITASSRILRSNNGAVSFVDLAGINKFYNTLESDGSRVFGGGYNFTTASASLVYSDDLFDTHTEAVVTGSIVDTQSWDVMPSGAGVVIATRSGSTDADDEILVSTDNGENYTAITGIGQRCRGIVYLGNSEWIVGSTGSEIIYSDDNFTTYVVSTIDQPSAGASAYKSVKSGDNVIIGLSDGYAMINPPITP